MLRKSNALVAGFLFVLAVVPAIAQTKPPLETRNAALRYWLAFADLQDPPADKGTVDLLEKTATGDAPWDEEKLGPILDKNEDAIWRMQRATKLPDCDWGLEYDLGPRVSIAYVPKARVLARLNILEGMRLLAKGDSQKAVDTWLAGVRFSQHLTKGGALIFSLIAKMALLSNFNALTHAAQAGSLNEAQRKQVETAVRALPETGFDWSAALWYEQDPLDVVVKQLKSAENRAVYYEGVTGKPAPENLEVPNPAEIAKFHKLMAAAIAAMKLPPEQAKEKLKIMQDSVKSLHPLYQQLAPSFTRVNEARAQVQSARQKLLEALPSR